MVIFLCDENTIRPDIALGHMAGKTGSSLQILKILFKVPIF